MSSGHSISHHPRADDSHLHVCFASGHSTEALNVHWFTRDTGLQVCLAPVQSWMSTNKLKLNPDTTEFLHIWNK